MEWLFFGLAIIFILVEFIFIGGFFFILSLAALSVGVFFHLQFLSTLLEGLTYLLILSVIFIFFFILIGTKLSPLKVDTASVDEDLEAIGQEAVVLETVTAEQGRISFRGTTWFARSDITILPNEPAEIVRREGMTWIIRKKKGE